MSQGPWYRRALPLALAASLCIPFIASGQGIPKDRAPLTTTLGEISALRTAYVDAFNAKDAKALSAMYTTNAIIISADGSQTEGGPAISKMFADSAANWPHAVVKSSGLRLYGTTAVDVGTWTVHPKAGGEMVSRYLVVLRKDMKGWKLAYSANAPMSK